MSRIEQPFVRGRGRDLLYQRAGGLFALLFDPSLPPLFLLGAILLAVAGNAAYDLLLRWWGDKLEARLGALLGSLVLLWLVVAGLRAVLRMHRPTPINLSPEEKADPRRGLILYLTPGEGKADEVALNFHLPSLTHLWMVYTSETADKCSRLAEKCQKQGIQPLQLRMEQPRDAGEAYRLVRGALHQAAEAGLGPSELYVDITSCLRPAAIGASLAALESGYEVEYVAAQYDSGGRSIPGTAQVMRVRVQPS